MTVYEATVDFIAEGETYGTETYFVRADDAAAADRKAMSLSEESRYHDSRIDFRREPSSDEIEDVPEGAVVHDAEPKGHSFGS